MDERETQTAPETTAEEPEILDEICVEELAIDGICGVY
jgi:mycofactocin precursor